MAYRITGTEVRDRLRTLTALEVTDTTLASAAYIPMSEAYLNKLLGDSGYAALGTTDQAIAKSLQINICALIVVTGAQTRRSKTSIAEITPVTASEMKDAADELRKQNRDFMTLLGLSKYTVYIASSGGDDYDPDLTGKAGLSMAI